MNPHKFQTLPMSSGEFNKSKRRAESWSPPRNIAFRPHHSPYSEYHFSMPPFRTESFESSGGSIYPPPYQAVAYPPVPPVTYSYSMPFPSFYYPHQVMPKPIQFISDVKSDDVLCGRGGATNSHSGNRAFRGLVKAYQHQYLAAKKKDKPSVAFRVVEEIRKKGGRFLRKCNMVQGKEVLWMDIGDDAAREKTCQALREGAPKLRSKYPSEATKTDLSPQPSQEDSSFDEEEKESDSSDNDTTEKTSTFSLPIYSIEYDPDFEGFQGPSVPNGQITICPLENILQGRYCPVSVSLDSLSSHDRDVYLKDFLPPSSESNNPGVSRSDSLL